MITAIVPVSPVKSHPDTSILETTIGSIRHHLPDAEIIVTFDGVRPEQEDLRPAYEEHIRKALWMADHTWGAGCPYVFDEHLHQVGMLRRVFGEIRTPYLMYVEQDTPLVTDELIAWDGILHFLGTGESNLVRLLHEAYILPDHEHMMHGWDGNTYMRTSQWSQRPHIASTAYYRRILDAHFTPNARCFLEDVMHGVVDNAYRTDGIAGWMQHRLHVYLPSKTNSKRSYHLDGRDGGPKWDDTQTF